MDNHLFLKKTLRFYLSFVLCLFLIRFISFEYLSNFNHSYYVLSIKGFVNDLSYGSRVFIILGILQWSIDYFSKRTYTFLFYLFPILLLWVELVLIEYLRTMSVMLGEALYNYSFHEIVMISGGTGSLNLFIILGFILVPIVFVGFKYIFSTLKKQKKIFTPIGTILLLGLAILPAITKTNNVRFNQFVNNNTSYFISRTFYYLTHHSDRIQPKTANYKIKDFKNISSHFYGGKPLSYTYPFFHKFPDSSQFSSYFKKTSDGKTPNIVIIICESLGTNFVGDYADKTGHVMPFLDSLSKQSLYWPNFMSVCDRTYHVFPGSLASIPIIPRGRIFMEMKPKNYFSIMNLLDKAYFSRFLSGSFMSYTHMGSFMSYNHTNYLVKDWGSQFSNTIDGQEIFWGYPDKELFEKSWVDYKHQQLDTAKRLDIFMTVTTHPPYVLRKKKEYIKKTKKLILKNEKKKGIDHSHILADYYLDIYSTYTYLDDQLRSYFKKAAKKPNFNNTIFLIYGDHAPANADDAGLSPYKVPLIIYSPLLKKAEKFLGVSSQLDIAPTLINYLRLNYLPKLPAKTTFIGKELSFSKKYKNKRTLLLGTFIRNNDYYMDNGYLIRNSNLFKVGENLTLHKIKNKKIYAQLKEQKKIARDVVNYSVYNNKFGPKKYINQYTTAYTQTPLKTITTNFVRTRKDQKNLETIPVGEPFEIRDDIDRLLIDFKIKCKGENTNLSAVPKLTISMNDEEGNYVYWTNLYYFQKHSLKANEWNQISAYKVIDLASILKNKNWRGGTIKVTFYLSNPDNIKMELKDSRIVFYQQMEKK